MSSVVISGDTSGSVSVTVPAVAGSNTITLPAVTGTAVVGSSAVSAVGQIPFSTDGSTYTPTAKIVRGTAVATTSGTAVDFTSIPSWVKRISVMYSGVSTNNTSAMLVQIGTGGTPTTSGYVGVVAGVSGATSASATLSAGFSITRVTTAANTYQGICVITNITGNTWTASWNTADSNLLMQNGAGTLALSGTLDMIRFTSVTPDTFDAGTVNILYE